MPAMLLHTWMTVIHTPYWETLLGKVEAVLNTLMANPGKCTIGLVESKYLMYIVGRDVLKPHLNTLEAIQNWSQMNRKEQV